MKKLFVIALVSSLSVTALQAQHTSFGVKAGYNSSSVQIENANDYDSKSGFHVGGLAHIHVTKHFAVQPELMYSTQGGESGNTKLKINYINAPVLVQYMVNNGFRLQTGPQIGFLTSAEQKIGDVEVDIDDAYDAVDFSWVFGASYIFKSGIGIDARYNLGLTDISDNQSFEAKNRVLQVGLFYQFKKNGKPHKK